MSLSSGLAALLALALVCPGVARGRNCIQSESAQKPNFSGTWRLDPARVTRKATPKSVARKDPPPPPDDEDDDPGIPSITIRHQDPNISIMTTSADGEDVSVMNLTTDGRENTNPVDEGNTYKSKSHWEGPKLITEWTIEQYGTALNRGSDTRSLSEDGATMILETRLETDEEVIELHQVFVRKAK
jgi:hypothetical protein